MRAIKRAVSVAAFGLLAGCAGLPTPQVRYHLALELAAHQHWRPALVQAGAWHLMSMAPSPPQLDRLLTVYIEGDGLAWIGRTTPAADPTPANPLALRLALAHPQGAVAYLARPCQYQQPLPQACVPALWTDARYAPEMVQAMDAALEVLKNRAQATQLVLVGYSGGGGMAVLLAARRTDVGRLVTVAGNLDTVAWTEHHRLSPMDRSMNPADHAHRVALIEQFHFAGADDAVVPPSLLQGLPQGLSGRGGAHVKVMPGFDHRCCWVRAWPALLPAHAR